MPLVADPAMERAPAGHEEIERPPASITVTRTSEEDFKQRQLIVYLDEQKLATLMWGDSVTRDVEPGPHRLRVSNTLVWKTVEFTTQAGEQVFFEVVNRAGFAT